MTVVQLGQMCTVLQAGIIHVFAAMSSDMRRCIVACMLPTRMLSGCRVRFLSLSWSCAGMKVSEQITAGMQTGCSPTAACFSCRCTQTITCMEPSRINHSKTRGKPLSCLQATLSWHCWPWSQLLFSLSWTQEQLQHSRFMTLVRGSEHPLLVQCKSEASSQQLQRVWSCEN